MTTREYRTCKGCGSKTLSPTLYCSNGKCGKIQSHIKYAASRENVTQLNEELINRYSEKFYYTNKCGFTRNGFPPCEVLTKEGYCGTHRHRVLWSKGLPCLNCKILTSAKNGLCSKCKKEGYKVVPKPQEEIKIEATTE